MNTKFLAHNHLVQIGERFLRDFERLTFTDARYTRDSILGRLLSAMFFTWKSTT